MLSGPTGHCNFLNPSCALVLLGLHSPGCHLVLFVPVYHFHDDFLHLFSVSMACPPSVYHPRAAPMNWCSLADLMQATQGLATGWPQKTAADPTS